MKWQTRRKLTALGGGLALLCGCQSAQSWVPKSIQTAVRPAEKVESITPPKTSAKSEKSKSDAAADAVQLASAEETVPPLPTPAPMPADTSALSLQTVPTDTAIEGGVTLAMLEYLALEHNPAIKQACASVSKAQGFRRQVGRTPNPSLGYNGTQLDDAGTDQHTAFITQDIITGKKLRLNEQVIDQEVQAMLWEVETQRYRVLTDVRQRFYVALAAQRRRDLAREFDKVTGQGVRIAIQRREALEGSTVDVLQAEIQDKEVRLIGRKADIDYNAAVSELTALVGVPRLAANHLVGELRIPSLERDWDLFYEHIVATSPEVRGAFSRIGRSQALIGRQEAQPIPNVGLYLGAGHDYGTGSQLINVQVEMPIPVFNRNQGNISAAFAEYCRNSQDMRRLELSLKARLARGSRDYDSALATVDLYETEVLPRAQRMLELAEEAYGAGETSFLEILISRRIYFESNLQYVTALGDLAEANAFLDGMLLTGGLDSTPDTEADAGLRDQALSGQ